MSACPINGALTARLLIAAPFLHIAHINQCCSCAIWGICQLAGFLCWAFCCIASPSSWYESDARCTAQCMHAWGGSPCCTFTVSFCHELSCTLGHAIE